MSAGAESLLHHLRRLLGRPQLAAADSDAALLDRFVQQQDQAAFTALIARHGPLVLGVCRRVLHDGHAAEDVFQATFLLLARKAGSLRNPHALAAWLHGTARRLALKCRQTDTRRRRRETGRASVRAAPGNDPLEAISAREMLELLDDELQRLPEVYRLPLILCALEGRPQEEAARLLGWTPGSLRGRLERGRARLHARLVRRGLTLPATLLASGAVTGAVEAAPAALVQATRRAVGGFLSGGPQELTPAVRLLVESALGNPLAAGVKVVVLLLAVAAGASLLVAHLQAIKRRAAERAERAANKEAEEWPTGREEHSSRTDRLGEPLPPGAIARLGTTRLRPGIDVEHLSFSPDGKRLLSRASSVVRVPDHLTVWDAVTGRPLHDLELPNHYPGFFTWLKDGRVLGVLAQGNGKDLACNVGAGLTRPPLTFRPGAGGVGFAVAGDDLEHEGFPTIAPNGKLAAVGRYGMVQGKPRWIDLRELVVGQHVEDMKTIRRLGPHPGNCGDLHFSADSRLLLAMTGPERGRETALLSLWEVATGKKVAQHTIAASLQKGGFRGEALSPDGMTFALGSPDGKARLFDLATGRRKYELTVTRAGSEHESGVTTLAFSPDGKRLFAGGRDCVLHAYETATGRELWAKRGHSYWIEAVAVSSDGKHIASGGQDGQIRIWDAATGANVCPLDGHENWLASVAVSPDGRRVVSSSRDGSAWVWETATGRPLRRIEIGTRSWPRCLFTPDGRKILGASDDRIRLWDAATGAAAPLPGPLADHPCSRAEFSPDGKTLVIIARREALVWEWPMGRLRRRIEVRPDVATSVKMYCSGLLFSPDGSKLLVWTVFEPARRGEPEPPGSAVDVWDISSGKHLRRLGVAPIEFEAGVYLANGVGALLRQEKGLASVDVQTGKARQLFAAPERTYSAACSPDGRVVARAVGPGAVQLYEAATGLPRRRLQGHRGAVMALSFTPDGKRLITGSTDTTALVWDVSLDALAEPAELPPEQLWDDLAARDTKTVNRALASLAAAPEAAVALLKERLHPATGPDAATLDRLIADLDSEQFTVREKASAALERLGEDVVPGLRRRLNTSESAEVRRRLQRLIDRCDPREPSAEHVRLVRALEVLEHIGTAEAQAVLADLAKGAPEAWPTQEARRCLERLGARRPKP